MSQYDQLASKETIDKIIEALKANGIEAKFVQTGEDAKAEVFSLIPEGAEVMNMTSVTLDTIGVSKEILESKKYDSVRNKLNTMDRETQNLGMQKLGAGPDWAIGSVHAVTEQGEVVIASNTGSQLSAYAGGASHVIWVVGTQKIVKTVDEGIKRIYEYILDKESERLSKAIGKEIKSNPSKLLIVKKEIRPGRITLIFVGEKLGF